MARKSKAQIEKETLDKQHEINRLAEERVANMLPTLVAKLVEQIGGARIAAGTAAPADSDADRTLAKSLAHAMMEASATPAKRAAMITPEQKAERDIARQEMVDMIIANNAAGLVPIYRITAKTFLSETLVDPQYRDPQSKQMVDQEINWKGVPNQAMTPVIREASGDAESRSISAGKAVYELYLRSIGRNPGINQNRPSQWVTSGKELLRAAPTRAPSPLAPQAPGGDPRRSGAMSGASTVRLLGSTAEPAVITP